MSSYQIWFRAFGWFIGWVSPRDFKWHKWLWENNNQKKLFNKEHIKVKWLTLRICGFVFGYRNPNYYEQQQRS